MKKKKFLILTMILFLFYWHSAIKGGGKKRGDLWQSKKEFDMREIEREIERVI